MAEIENADLIFTVFSTVKAEPALLGLSRRPGAGCLREFLCNTTLYKGFQATKWIVAKTRRLEHPLSLATLVKIESQTVFQTR